MWLAHTETPHWFETRQITQPKAYVKEVKQVQPCGQACDKSSTALKDQTSPDCKTLLWQINVEQNPSFIAQLQLTAG